MHRRAKVILGVLIAFAALVGIAIAGGCSSSTLPPKLTAAQVATIRNCHIAVSIGVAPYKYPVYSESLIKDLRATGIFDTVDSIERVKDPALVAVVERPVHGTATIPVMTIVTFGILPTTVEEEHGYAFSIRSPSDPGELVRIDYTYRGPTTLGWCAFFLNFLSDRTGGNPEETSRFRDGLAAALSAQRNRIVQLTIGRVDLSDNRWGRPF
jgi:hypothetical protein